MLNIKITGDRELIARLTAMGPRVQRELVRTVTSLAFSLEALVKRKLTNQVLKVRTGSLRASIDNQVLADAKSVRGKVYSSGDVKYAAIHEFGGTIQNPGGQPYIVTKDGVRFISKTAAAGMKRPPPVTRPFSVTMPERSFLRSSLAEMKTTIQSDLTGAVRRGLQQER